MIFVLVLTQRNLLVFVVYQYIDNVIFLIQQSVAIHVTQLQPIQHYTVTRQVYKVLQVTSTYRSSETKKKCSNTFCIQMVHVH
jgi:hypothetical protein